MYGEESGQLKNEYQREAVNPATPSAVLNINALNINGVVRASELMPLQP